MRFQSGLNLVAMWIVEEWTVHSTRHVHAKDPTTNNWNCHFLVFPEIFVKAFQDFDSSVS